MRVLTVSFYGNQPVRDDAFLWRHKKSKSHFLFPLEGQLDKELHFLPFSFLKLSLRTHSTKLWKPINGSFKWFSFFPLALHFPDDITARNIAFCPETTEALWRTLKVMKVSELGNCQGRTKDNSFIRTCCVMACALFSTSLPLDINQHFLANGHLSSK